MKNLIFVCLVCLSIGIGAKANEAQNSFYDSDKHLLWQDTFENALNKISFKRALSYCEILELEGLKDWRLPTNSELQTLIDLHRIPAIKPNVNYTAIGCYWTYSSNKVGGIDFQEGTIYNHLNNECFVRCVHKSKK